MGQSMDFFLCSFATEFYLFLHSPRPYEVEPCEKKKVTQEQTERSEGRGLCML